MLHGLLLDHGHEFFVQQKSHDGRSPLDDKWDLFSIVQELVPSSVALRLADKVLFTGKAALIVKSIEDSSSHSGKSIAAAGWTYYSHRYFHCPFPPLVIQQPWTELDLLKGCFAAD